MRNNIVAITATEAKGPVERAKDEPLEERARIAFKAAAGGFMAPEPDEVLAAGIAALRESATDEEKEIIDAEVAVIGHANRVMAGAMSGLPIAWDEMPEGPEMPEGAVQLAVLWREAVGSEARV